MAIDLLQGLGKQYGPVTRSRGVYLYTKKCVRLIDMYLDGGLSILGRRGQFQLLFKNILDKGLTGFFPTEYSCRINKALSVLLHNDVVAFPFATKDGAFCFARKLGLLCKERVPFADFAFCKKEAALVGCPFPIVSVYFLCVCTCDLTGDVALQGECDGLLQISAPYEAAIARAIYNLVAFEKKYGEKDFSRFDSVVTQYWVRGENSPFLFPKMQKEKYLSFAKHCLSCKLFISPIYDTPSIVPFTCVANSLGALQKNGWSS